MIALIAGVLVTPFAALGWSMADDVSVLAATVRRWFEHGLPGPPEWIARLPVIGERLSTRWREFVQSGGTSELAGYVATLRDALTRLGTGLLQALFELLLSLIVAFFLYCNGPAVAAALSSLGHHLTGARGQRLIAVGVDHPKRRLWSDRRQRAAGAAGRPRLGPQEFPAPFCSAFFIFFLTLIPLGPALIWLPAILWLVNADKGTAVLLLFGWCVLIFPVLENVVRPYLVKRGSQLPGLLILLGMLGGLAAFGFLGVFLGPALLALAYADRRMALDHPRPGDRRRDETILIRSLTSPARCRRSPLRVRPVARRRRRRCALQLLPQCLEYDVEHGDQEDAEHRARQHPPNTAVPTPRRLSMPAPVAITSGMRPAMKAKLVIITARNRSRAFDCGVCDGKPMLAPFLGESTIRIAFWRPAIRTTRPTCA